MIELEKLHELVPLMNLLEVVAHNGSIQGASVRLRRTPSAISQAVKKAEEVADQPLFHRSKRGFQASPALLKILATYGSFKQELKSLVPQGTERPQAVSGVVRIIGQNQLLRHYSQELFSSFLKSHPQVKLEISMGSADVALEALKENRVDIAICGGVSALSRASGIVRETLGTLQLGLVSSVVFHRRFIKLAGDAPVRTRDLLSLPHISSYPDHSLLRSFYRHLGVRAPRLKLNVAALAFDMGLIRKLLLEHLGLAIAVLDFIQKDLSSGKLIQAVPFVMTHPLFLCHSRDRLPSDAMLRWKENAIRKIGSVSDSKNT